MPFHYVYILVHTEADQDRFYTGLTDNLRRRLAQHNTGEVAHTAKYHPWRVKTAVAFRDRARAAAFEAYLKTASGRAFASKRL